MMKSDSPYGCGEKHPCDAALLGTTQVRATVERFLASDYDGTVLQSSRRSPAGPLTGSPRTTLATLSW